MIPQAVFVGSVVLLFCVYGLLSCRRLILFSNKGRRLVQRWGEQRALWLVRALLLAGAVFGFGLATGFLRPMQW